MGNRKKSFVQSFWQTAKIRVLQLPLEGSRSTQKHCQGQHLGTASRDSKWHCPGNWRRIPLGSAVPLLVNSLRYNYTGENIHKNIHSTWFITAKDRSQWPGGGDLQVTVHIKIWKALQTQDVTGSKRHPGSAVTAHAQSCSLLLTAQLGYYRLTSFYCTPQTLPILQIEDTWQLCIEQISIIFQQHLLTLRVTFW